jgi:hypothetical protein
MPRPASVYAHVGPNHQAVRAHGPVDVQGSLLHPSLAHQSSGVRLNMRREPTAAAGQAELLPANLLGRSLVAALAVPDELAARVDQPTLGSLPILVLGNLDSVSYVERSRRAWMLGAALAIPRTVERVGHSGLSVVRQRHRVW